MKIRILKMNILKLLTISVVNIIKKRRVYFVEIKTKNVEKDLTKTNKMF